MRCRKCDGLSWILYQIDAPSPPYKENQKLDYGVRCDECYGTRGDSKDTRN
jgi:hypothetical protein